MDHAKLVVIRMEEARDSRGISVAELARRASIDRKRLWWIGYTLWDTFTRD